MASFKRVAGTFLVLFVFSVPALPATAQDQPYQQYGQQYFSQQKEYAPQTQFTSQPNCAQCPSGYRPTYGAGRGSANIFKATIILEDCPPCPPGYVSGNGIGLPQAISQQNSYNYAQQPLLSPSNYYSTNQQQPNNGQPPYNQQGFNYGAPSPNYQQSGPNNYNFESGTLSSGFPTQTLSFPQRPSTPQQQGSFGYGGNQPQQGFGGQTQSNQPLLSSSTNYGELQPPYYGSAYGQREQSEEGQQPGYLTNYHGDFYTNPQRTQETRALNEPFYQSIGGEPRYPGGDGNTHSMGFGNSYVAAGKPYSTEKAKEVIKEKAKERRRFRRK